MAGIYCTHHLADRLRGGFRITGDDVSVVRRSRDRHGQGGKREDDGEDLHVGMDRARLSWEDLCVLAVGGKTKQTDGDDAGVLLWRGWGCFKVGSGRGPLL